MNDKCYETEDGFWAVFDFPDDFDDPEMASELEKLLAMETIF